MLSVKSLGIGCATVAAVAIAAFAPAANADSGTVYNVSAGQCHAQFSYINNDNSTFILYTLQSGNNCGLRAGWDYHDYGRNRDGSESFPAVTGSGYHNWEFSAPGGVFITHSGTITRRLTGFVCDGGNCNSVVDRGPIG